MPVMKSSSLACQLNSTGRSFVSELMLFFRHPELVEGSDAYLAKSKDMQAG
jgi:hypothetical protein